MKKRSNSIISSLVLYTIFLAFLIGTRNPLSPLSIGLPQPRELFWALFTLFLALFYIVFFNSINIKHLLISKSKILVALMPIFYFAATIFFAIFNLVDAIFIIQNLALLILSISVLLVSFGSLRHDLFLFWFLLAITTFIFFCISIFNGPQEIEGHFTALSIGRISFGQYMGIGAITSWFLAFVYNRKIFIPLGFLLVLATALSGSRGAFLGLLVCAVIVFLIIKNKTNFALFASTWAFIIAMLSFGPLRIPILENRFSKTNPLDSSGRDKIWSSKIEQISNAQLDVSNDVSNQEKLPISEGAKDSIISSDIKAHNLFLETLIQSGTIGLVLILATILVPVPFVYKAIRKNIQTALPAVLTVYCLIVAQFSGDMYENSLLWFFYCLTVSKSLYMSTRIQNINETKPFKLIQISDELKCSRIGSSLFTSKFFWTIGLLVVSVILILQGNSW